MILEYEGVDISDDVQIDTAWHDGYFQGHSDKLILKLSDVDALWDKWQPKEGDRIRVSDGPATTGLMYVDSMEPESSLMRIRALSMPPKAAHERRNKSWEEVRLSQLCQEVCNRWGLGYRSYGVTDRIYAYVEQRGEPDFEFLFRRLAYEGLGFLVYDGNLVIYDTAYMDAQEPQDTITVHPGMDYSLTNDRDRFFGSCLVTDGNVTGTFTVDSAGKQLHPPINGRISDEAEAERFAHGLLRHQNATVKTVKLTTETFLTKYAAGSVFDLEATASASWDGPAIIEHIRHDYVRRRSTLWARKTITDY